MYRVTIYNGETATVLHEPARDRSLPHLHQGQLAQGLPEEIDSLTFSILPNNPGYDLLEIRTTLVQVVDTRTGRAEFTGRVLSVTPQMEESGLIYKAVVCEDRLGYLCDSVQPYTAERTYTGDSTRTGLEEFIDLVLANHNAQVEAYKQVFRGNVSVTQGNVTKGLNYQSTWECLQEKLIGSFGGELYLYPGTDGRLYLDYVPELGETGSATIEMGKNMRSITREINPSGIITRLIPLGATVEGGDGSERVTIASVNDGQIYVDDTAAQGKYGIVVGTVAWDDVTEPANLLKRAQDWLESQTILETVSLSAIDLSLIGLEADALERYNYYRVINAAVGLDAYLRVVKRTVNITDPTDITFELGQRSMTMGSMVSASNQASADAMQAIEAELGKTVLSLIAARAEITDLVAANAEVKNLVADKASIEDLTAATARIDELKAENAEIKNLVAENADLTNADIENLNADVANIKTILAGSAGVGELQAVHMTADNTVIDDALITDAMIANLSAGKLTAGQIITDLIQIMSENGRLLLDGETIQIKDANRVRVQIGKDAAGDYNLALWDAAGDLLWDASGVYAAGLHNGIIRDIAVADDANISGNKLNISSVAQRLTEDGTLEVTGSQVTVDNTKLDVAYKTITTKTETAQSTAEAAQSTADTAKTDAATAQSTANTAKTNAAAAQSAADQAQADANAAQSTADTAKANAATAQSTANTAKTNAATAQSTADTAKANAATAQSAAEAAQADADDALEQVGAVTKRTTTLETNLSVVQGQIQSKVWKSDITEATDPIKGDVTTLQDQYTQITQDVDNIELSVGNLTTRYDTLAVGGRNLIILSTAAEGGRLNQDGTVYSQADHTITDYIPVEAGGNYLLTVWAASAGTQYVALAYYTADKGFIERKMSSNWTAGQTWELPAPETAAYARASFPATLAGAIKLEKGTVPTDYTPAPEDTEADIQAVEAKLELKVDQDKLISEINASADIIHLKSNRLIVESDNLSIAEDGTLTARNGAFTGSVTANTGRIGGWTVGEQALFCETEHGLVELYPLVGREIVNDPQAGVILPQSTILRVRGYPGINASEEQAASLQDFFAVNQDGQVDLWALRTETFADIGGWLGVHGDLDVSGNAAVTGSLSTYGFTVPRIQHGQLTISVDAGVTSNFFFTFPRAFPGTPTVVLTPQHPTASPGASMEMHCKLTSVNDSRVDGTFFYTSGGTWTIHWMAMYG